MTLCWWLRDGRLPADRYARVEQPARALGAQVRILEPGAIEQVHAAGGTAVFRMPHTERELQAIEQARRLGARIVVDADDYTLGPRMRRLLTLTGLPIKHTRATFEQALTRTYAAQELLETALEQADAVTVASRALAEAYAPHARAIYVIPNQIEPGDWPPLEGEDASSPVFRVGFAGSRSHVNDIELIRPALAWAARQPGVEVIVCGWHPGDVTTEPELEQITELVRIAMSLAPGSADRRQLLAEAITIAEQQRDRWTFPLSLTSWTDDISEHYRNLQAFDVGLCPADDRAPWSRYRSDLKPLEYAMAGALPIVSRSRCYTDPGWPERVPSAGSAEQFTQLIRWALEHRERVRERALELREQVLAERTIEANLWRWEEALAG